jgi:predicted lipoprotein with Yx(FWY)xxD motif
MPEPDAAPATSTPQPAPVLQIREIVGFGLVLAAGDGFTLYTFDLDTAAESVCTDACADIWPPLTTDSESPAVAEGVPGNAGTVLRADGRRQLTYDGHPLYRYSGDLQPGDAGGDGVDGLWHVVIIAPPTQTR